MDTDALLVEYTQQLAIFTKWLVIATFVLGAIALVMGFWQASISRSTARRQLRAYVGVESINLLDLSQLKTLERFEESTASGLPGPNHPGVTVTIKNSGQTPATGCVHMVAIDLIEVRHENMISPPNGIILGQGSTSDLSANGTTSTNLWLGQAITSQDISDIIAGRKAIYVFGRIEYIDAFKKRRSTTYKRRYSGLYPPLDSHSFVYCSTGNSIS